jgi:hypothetical protein
MAFFICNFIPVPSFTDILNKGLAPLIPKEGVLPDGRVNEKTLARFI